MQIAHVHVVRASGAGPDRLDGDVEVDGLGATLTGDPLPGILTTWSGERQWRLRVPDGSGAGADRLRFCIHTAQHGVQVSRGFRLL